MNEYCYTGLIGNIPFLFVPDSIMFASPVLADLGMKAYEGEIFFYISATDLWGRIRETENGKLLELLEEDEPVLECPVDSRTAAVLQPESAFLLIGAPFQISEAQILKEVEPPAELEQIEAWMRSKEETHQLETGDFDALILGVYETKPFE
ncbi:hypothetical protein HHL16_12335 [Pseudoflavitalea sp. G-6-1-2]|uniref:hypothetical protein n=1 Tax=Pseudoflavitalea sp. G-6-1-2 TaxID=2728841 RepID=UPI00146C6BD5|nr:hypothetical protein [Pseudoflavitalea sp. G-6-1-2]NML21670.1 hypothetical protein [Pseudoflavitalea sp. G-6-1-2]